MSFFGRVVGLSFRERPIGIDVPVGGGPGADTGHTEEIISLSWPVNALASPRQAGVGGRGKGSLGFSAHVAAPKTQQQISRIKWIDILILCFIL